MKIITNITVGLSLGLLLQADPSIQFRNITLERIKTLNLKIKNRKSPIRAKESNLKELTIEKKSINNYANSNRIATLQRQTRNLKGVYALTLCVSFGLLCYEIISVQAKKPSSP